jgi:transcription initiation factor TFIIB
MTYNLQSNEDKNYTKALKIIKKYCDVLDLKEGIPKKAEEIYLDVYDKSKIKGKRLETLIAGIVYLACKRNKVSLSSPTQ